MEEKQIEYEIQFIIGGSNSGDRFRAKLGETMLKIEGYSDKGSRNFMEDFQVAGIFKRGTIKGCFAAVFDGHGGLEAANYSKTELIKNILNLKSFWSNNTENVLNAIKCGFLLTHCMMKKEQAKWPTRPKSGALSTSGTTASIVLFMRNQIFYGHVGDSRIVLGKSTAGSNWTSSDITSDHKPRDANEQEQVKIRGGKIQEDRNGNLRVVWRNCPVQELRPSAKGTEVIEMPFLNMTRAIGDFWSFCADTKRYAVSPSPDVGVFPFDESHRCVIVASDGLWDVFSSSESVQMTEKSVNGYIPKHLVSEALSKCKTQKKRIDNISAIIITFAKSFLSNS